MVVGHTVWNGLPQDGADLRCLYAELMQESSSGCCVFRVSGGRGGGGREGDGLRDKGEVGGWVWEERGEKRKDSRKELQC